jgi:hypothetical protein
MERITTPSIACLTEIGKFTWRQSTALFKSAFILDAGDGGESGAGLVSEEFIGMDADESYMDVFMRSSETNPAPD